MPEFANPFAGNNLNRKLSHEELVRAVRYNIAAEFEAIQMYMQVVEATDNPLAKEVFKDIANEERVHAGEFYRLLLELEPAEKEFYEEGMKEVEEEIEKMKLKK
jgi:rubrerythrin